MIRLFSGCGFKWLQRIRRILPLSLLAWSVIALADSAQEYNVKAAIVLNFARFSEWPETAFKKENAHINLCVLGDNVVQQAFSEINGKQAGKRSLAVNYLTKLRNLDDCHLLFISGQDKNKTIQLLSEIRNQPVLSIGEEDYFADSGGMVNLLTQDGKVTIQVNVDASRQAALAISSRVLKLATIVKSK